MNKPLGFIPRSDTEPRTKSIRNGGNQDGSLNNNPSYSLPSTKPIAVHNDSGGTALEDRWRYSPRGAETPAARRFTTHYNPIRSNSPESAFTPD